IRGFHVTGVQTCALPISAPFFARRPSPPSGRTKQKTGPSLSSTAPAMACHFPGRRSRGAASPVDLAELLDDERAHHAEGFVAGLGADGLVRAGRARGELKRGRLARLNERRRQVQSVYVPVVGDGALVADDQADPLA